MLSLSGAAFRQRLRNMTLIPAGVAAESTAALIGIGMGGLVAWRARRGHGRDHLQSPAQQSSQTGAAGVAGGVPAGELGTPAAQGTRRRNPADPVPLALPRMTTRPMVVTFSGLDGAGKSTLIGLLRTDLEADRRQVAVLHFGDDVTIYGQLRRARDLVTGRTTSVAPGTADPRSQKIQRPHPRGWRGAVARVRQAILWNKVVRRLLYPMDALIFLTYRWTLARRNYSVVLMDRYFYDWLVDVSDGRQHWWVSLLERLTPVPTVAVHLDITPEESYQRKSEFTLEYLRDRAEAYHRVFRRVPTAVRIVNDDLQRTRATLWRVVAERGGGV